MKYLIIIRDFLCFSSFLCHYIFFPMTLLSIYILYLYLSYIYLFIYLFKSHIWSFRQYHPLSQTMPPCQLNNCIQLRLTGLTDTVSSLSQVAHVSQSNSYLKDSFNQPARGVAVNKRRHNNEPNVILLFS